MASLASTTCGKCHQGAWEAWRLSHHAQANRPVSKLADAAMFSGQKAETHGSSYTFEKDETGHPIIHERRREDGTFAHRPGMVIARTPLWQYAVESEPGRFQCTEVAWDPAHEEWFGVFGAEERNPGEWGHWSGRGMNWNSMCARCHMTAYARNYDAETDRYSSQWVEHGIGCIQCHQAMPGHEPGGEAMQDVDNFARDPHRMMQSCAPCHSRAESLTPGFAPGESYDDHYRLQLPVEPALYHPDGQILDEVFVYGSFRHSKMHAAGVTCMDCHEPHSGALKLPQENNQICQQCHAEPGRDNAPVIDPTGHSFHAAESTGNRCVECHMVETTYMQRDARRDHGFIIPDPVLSRELGVPNACSRCHADKPLDWNIGHYDKWYGQKMAESRHRERARAVAKAFAADAAAMPQLLELLDSEKVPAWRASLLTLAERLAPGAPAVVDAARSLREDPDPLVRAAAVRVLAVDPGARPLVQSALADPVRLVRIDAAWALSPSLPADSQNRRELDVYLQDALDQPAGRLRMAQDLFNRGKPAEATAILRPALDWDPLSPGLPEALGFMLNAQGRPVEAAHALERAAVLAPADAQMPFLAALAWSEAGDLQRAEDMLGAALRRDPALGRGWYNLGLLQARTGRLKESIVSLQEAERLATDDADIPYALATVLLQAGRPEAARQALQRTLAIRPGHREAEALLRRLNAHRPQLAP